MLKNEPINSTAHYPHHTVWMRGRERDGGGLVRSIYGEEAERQYCKSGEKKLCSEGEWWSYRERCMREGRGEGRDG